MDPYFEGCGICVYIKSIHLSDLHSHNGVGKTVALSKSQSIMQEHVV